MSNEKAMIAALEVYAHSVRADWTVSDAAHNAATGFLNDVVFASEGRPTNLVEKASAFLKVMSKEGETPIMQVFG